MHFRSTLITALAVAAIVPSTAGAALTREQVIKRGDNACYNTETALNAAIRRNRPYFPFRVYYRNHAKLWKEQRRAYMRGTVKLASLLSEAESERKVHLRAYVRGRRMLARYVRRVIRAAEVGDKPTYDARAYTFRRRNAKVRPRARRYGFEVCGARP